MKLFIIYAALISLPAVGYSEEQDFVAHIYSEITYNVTIATQKRNWFNPFKLELIKQDQIVIRNYSRGSAWVLNGESGRIFITAAHVLGIGLENPSALSNQTLSIKSDSKNNQFEFHETEKYEIGQGNPQLVSVDSKSIRAIVTPLAYPVRKVAIISADCAAILVDDPKAYNGYKTHELSGDLPQVGQQVSVYGFGGSVPTPNLKTAQVSSVDAKNNTFTLNECLEAGYSGGVVLNEDNEVYGLVSGTYVGKTTLCRAIRDLKKLQFKSL